jgi:nucleoside-diphosphate-sugar epimerase
MLGGTSFFGKDIVRQLDSVGHNVTIFSWDTVLPEELSRFRHIQGDRNAREDLVRASRHDAWDVVIDNIAFDGPTIKTALSIFRDIKHYIFTSTISVYRYASPRTTQPLIEESVDYDYTPEDEDLTDIHWKYARGKMEAERELVRQERVPWTILRPPIVYGPSDVTERGFWYLKRLMDGGPILLPNNGAGSFRLGFSLDLAHLYVETIARSIAIGRIYNMGCREIITLRDFIDESAHVLGMKPHYVSAPYEELGDLGGPYAMNRNWIPDLSAVRRDLGFMPTPWPDVAEVSANWFRDCWKGDEQKLLSTREAELKLAQTLR